MDKVHRSIPVTVEDMGAQRFSSGTVMHRWKVRMEDGSTGLCWTPDTYANSDPYLCPFVVGKRCAFTTEPGKDGALKIRPYDVVEMDRENRITRIAAVNSAAALGASIDNFPEYAEKIFNWVTGQQQQ